MMAGGGFRHIPLIGEGGELTAILSASDILAFLGSNAIDNGLAIAKAASPERLTAAAARIPEGFAAMVSGGVQGLALQTDGFWIATHQTVTTSPGRS